MKIGKLEFKLKALILSLHISQAITMGFFLEALIAILRKNNMSLLYLSLVYFLGLFAIIKFLWAPVVDKIRFGKFGHYKAWLIILEILIVTTLVVISLFDITKSIKIIIILCSIFAFLAATQDIAIDALVYKICISDLQKNTANSIKGGGAYIGSFIGGGLVLILYDYFGWNIALSIPALAYLVSFYFMVNFKEPDSVILGSKNRFIVNEFIHFWKAPTRRYWLIILLLVSMPYSMGWGIMHPMLVDAGLQLKEIGFSISVVGCLAGAASSFLAARVINKTGKKKFLVTNLILQGFSILILLLLTGKNVNLFLASLSAFAMMFVSSPIIVVIYTYMMDEIDNKRLIGSQYAIQGFVYLISGILSASLGTVLAHYIGYKNVIILAFTLSILVAYLAYKRKK